MNTKPMLAFPFEDKTAHVVYPAFVQPKLDGFRCLAVIEDGTARLYSRTLKPITTLPHITAQLEATFIGQTVTLDGELYNHALRDNFNKITSTIKRNEVHADHELIEFHVYDTVSRSTYVARMADVIGAIARAKPTHIKNVETNVVNNGAELFRAFEAYKSQGYEGAMYRNPRSAYESKRSPALLKIKTFEDGEFLIVGAMEGSGKFMGCLGSFECVTPEGKTFFCAMNGDMNQLAEYLDQLECYVGRMLTVQYQGKTPDGSPRFPRGLRIREEI